MNLSALLSSDMVLCFGQMKSASPNSRLYSGNEAFVSDPCKVLVPGPHQAILLIMTGKGHQGKMILGYRSTKAECRSLGKTKPSSWYDLTLDQTSSAHNLWVRLALPVVSNSLQRPCRAANSEQGDQKSQVQPGLVQHFQSRSEKGDLKVVFLASAVRAVLC